MRLLAFDGRMGTSGDMLLGALVAAGADPSVLLPVEDALDVTYRAYEVGKNGILATRVDALLVEADGGDSRGEDHGDDHRRLRADGDDEADFDDGSDRDDAEHNHQYQYHHHDYTHSEEQTHHDGDNSYGYSQGHDHSHPYSHDDYKHHYSHDDHTHAEGHGPYRIYPGVVDLVRSMNLPSGVTANATAISRVFDEAEAEVHGTDLDETCFHEVDADDAVADVVGVCLLLGDLSVGCVVTGPVAVGGGEIEMSHGTYPVPVPAVVNITAAVDWSVRGGPVETESLTSTGVAILAHLVEGVETLPSMSVESSGYGVGGWGFSDHPNVLRAVVDDGGSQLVRNEITVLETNLNDVPLEALGGLQATLKDADTRDVTIVPTTMKKSRPGHLVKVVVKPEDAECVVYRLAVKTGTLGIREHGVGHRWTACREFEMATLDIDGDDYEASVKVASDADGVIYDRSAEYNDAFMVVNEIGVPVHEIMYRVVDTVASEAGGA